MSYARVDEIVRKAIEDLVDAGACRADLEPHIQPLEMAAINSIADGKRDQLLLNLEIKTGDLARRFGKSKRTIRNWRKAAINRKFVAATSSA
ncbi:DNA-binding transcriptional regulator YiaG [Lysobacter sp. OAE881]|jgi:DNA-binding transcriptional regulator YiaG